MKVTKKLEAEITALMEDYWGSYLRGDLDHWARYLVPDYRNIGGTREEIWNSRREILDYTNAVFDQMVGKAEVRNKKIQIIPYGPYFMVHEFFDLYVKADGEWMFYSDFRLSSLIQKTAKGWKVLHQHGSYPDSKTQEGEAFSFDKLKAENKKLKEAVKKRTAELEQKNRELEIDTALEKVRTIAMGMKEPADMPDVCRSISQQLQLLGVSSVRNVQTAIFYEERGTYMNYEYYTRHKKEIITETSYTNHATHRAFARKMMQGKGQFFTTHIKGRKVKDWIAYQKTTNVFIDRFLEKTDSLSYYWHSLGPVALGISTYAPLSKEELGLFMRFLKVFELAYTRYLDIEQAIMQTREAQIEAALERIRARALAMHHSEELLEVAKVLREQLDKLGQPELETSAIHFYEEDPEYIVSWRAFRISSRRQDQITYSRMNIPKGACAFVREMENKFKGRDANYTLKLEGKVQRDWYKVLFGLAPEIGPAMRKSGSVNAIRYYHFSRFRGGALLMVSAVEPSAGSMDLQRRAAVVFDLAYRRFRDLQKAEAQAREAQIETALERVRSRAMAMQHSEELSELVSVLFRELTKLGFSLTSSIIWIHQPQPLTNELWIASAEADKPARPYSITPFHTGFFQSVIRAWKARDPKWTYTLSGTDKKKFEKGFFACLPGLTPALRKALKEPEQVVFSATFNQFGALEIVETKPLTDEKFEILHRFGKVFESSYTRFNDLKKAEYQAREVQIELGLERVRARAMAMQHSGELSELVDTVFKELTKLDFALTWCIINIIDEPSGSNTVWAASPDSKKPPESYHMLFEDYPFHHAMMKFWKQRKAKAVYVLEGREKKIYDEYLFTKTEFRRVPKEAQAASKAIKRYACSFSFSNFGGLQTVGDEPLSDANLDILSRFGKVFDLTYTRFNDLKQAEAQARESQVQLALERVRARTLAMQRSEELQDTTLVLFQQFMQLGETTNQVSICIFDEDAKNGEMYLTLNGEKIDRSFTMDLEKEVFVMKQARKAFLDGEKSFSLTITGKALQVYNRWRNKLVGAKRWDESRAALKQSWYVNSVFFSRGMIGLSSASPAPDETLRLLERFAAVFDGTYTRFSDLKKAEEQARESQIQLALERVRARTMAMQKSEELPAAANLLFQQVQALGMPAWSAGYCIWDEDKKAITLSMSSEGVLQPSLRMPLTEDPSLMHFLEAHERGETFFVEEVGGEALKTHYQYLRTLPGVKETLDDIAAAGFPVPSFQVFHLAYFSQGFLLFITYKPVPEAHEIFKRFGNVFDQTYTRFLDLQKAEAQAREAKIETALEKVRSGTMAMQKSEELGGVATVLFRELNQLVDNLWTCGFVLCEKNRPEDEWWLCAENGFIPAFYLPNTGDVTHANIYRGWLQGETYHTEQLEGEALEAHYDWLMNIPVAKKIFDEMAAAGFTKPTWQKLHCAYFSRGYLCIITRVPCPEEEIFKRFAQVFDLTYTRFLDLQRAEAQAREAQIEAALEKVRSRSLAMHHTGELQDVVNIVAQQLLQMKIDFDGGVFIVINDEVDHDLPFWAAAGAADYVQKATVPFIDRPIVALMMTAIRNREPFLMERYTREEKDEFLRHLFGHHPWNQTPEIRKRELLDREGGLCRSVCISRFTSIGMTNHRGREFSEADNKILQRFGNVLEQSYTRFLDLQKAEAQAREAQIEAALERTRTQSMIMQHSNELDETLRVFHQQVRLLGIDSAFSFLWLPDEDQDRHIFWAAWAENDPAVFRSKAINYPLDRNEPATAQCLIDWKGREPVVSYYVPPEGINSYFATWNELIAGVEHLRPEYFREGLYYVEAFMKFGCFGVMVRNELKEDEKKILARFAVEFERTYTRFLDLQKAEAQAREAQVEAALEKVRGRTMAMQHSSELGDAANLLFRQLKELGIDAWTCGYNIWKEDKKAVTAWLSHGNLQPSFNYPLTENQTLKHFYEAALRGESLFVEEVGGEALEELYRDLATYHESEPVPGVSRDPGFIPPPFQVNHAAYFSYGYLLIVTYKPYPEAHDIFKRFAAVFEQTYTRFLDLQKAEAQAREAQIETALERVRSRTMGMQKSEELTEVIQLVYEQLLYLKIHVGHAGFFIDYKAREDYDVWVADPIGEVPSRVIIPYFDSVYYNRFNEAKKKGENFFPILLSFEEKNKFYEKLFAYVPGLTEAAKNFYFNCPGLAISTVLLEDIGLYIENFDGIPYSDEENAILLRFGKVFQQTYTRFNDLKKAEAQAREARIEAALEKIRSRTMAMQRSEELSETAAVLFEQLRELGEQPERAFIGVVNEEEHVIEIWATRHGGTLMKMGIRATIDEPFVMNRMYRAWKKHKKSLVIDLKGDELEGYFQFLKNLGAPVNRDIFGERRFENIAFFSKGMLGVITPDEQKPEAIQLYERFAGVFDLTYTRFLDLQKAEDQAREAQIELALERVRARTMAMHRSDELSETAQVLFQQMTELGDIPDRIAIGIMDENERVINFWTTDQSGIQINVSYQASYDEPTTISKIIKAWKAQEKSAVIDLQGKELHDWIRYVRTGMKLEVKEDLLKERRVHHVGFFSHGILLFTTHEPLPAESVQILERFASVFNLTYRRFLDLQQAEAQTREAQIEAALEKVRSRSLAMHKSSELSEVVAVLFEKIGELGIKSDGININILDEGTRNFQSWLAEPGHRYATCFHVPYFSNPVVDDIFDAYNAKQELLSKVYTLEEKSAFFNHLYTHTDFKYLPDDRKNLILHSPYWEVSIAFAKNSALSLHSYTGKIFSDNENNILKRFARVFEQSYTRFLDLHKAEIQAREAQIEASLERVRGKAIAMHSSKDLSEAVNVFFGELKILGITPIRCGVGAVDERERTSTLSATTAQQQGESYEVIGQLKLEGHPVLDNIFRHWKEQREYFPVLRGKEITSYYQVMKPQLSFPDYPEEATHYGCYFYFREGLVFAWSEKEFSEEELRIFRRFTAVISLTFRRYIELQKSEANAREAVRRASLDRIRAEIASMRTVNDLERITPLVWNELTILGVPFIRCGVFIMDDAQSLMHTFLSTPDGKAIAAFHLAYDTPGNVMQIVGHWKEKKIFIDHWDENTFREWTETLIARGAIQAKDNYLASYPAGGFYLHFLPFLQGMLYVGNGSQLNEEEIKLVQSLADAFATAYARYEDFNKLEAAKQQVEHTLSDLRQAQQQLVQSEKMASLGELTAGIAHEIQNPLNFVNNFSEVSNELLDEMKTELDRGDVEEAKTIAGDVKQNLEKILHHGKRADAIVKGMLQHSRSSSGQKEPTDINLLADEYLRLSYHGLRAKDKTFNASFQSDFDPGLEKVNVIPQDIGRVILNLINNAFYAVSEKRKLNIPGYEPTVKITTKRILPAPGGPAGTGAIEIRVTDNGMGIPQRVLDKIFQPFFTTKPTGQGTGLGLSLSYDIITKGHRGELKVETKDGEGSEFIIQLPIN